MSIDNAKVQKIIDMMNIIALRKSEYFDKLWPNIIKKIPKEINENERKSLKDVLKEVIAEMDNDLFISKDEIESKKMNLNLKIEDIGIGKEKFWIDFKNKVFDKYPDLKGKL